MVLVFLFDLGIFLGTFTKENMRQKKDSKQASDRKTITSNHQETGDTPLFGYMNPAKITAVFLMLPSHQRVQSTTGCFGFCLLGPFGVFLLQRSARNHPTEPGLKK